MISPKHREETAHPSAADEKMGKVLAYTSTTQGKIHHTHTGS